MKRGKSESSLKNSKNVKIVLGIFALVLISAVLVYAAIVAGGYKIDAGATEKIDKYGLCRYVKNNYPLAIFVPTNSLNEWNTFILKSSTIISTCCGDGVCDSGEDMSCSGDCVCNPYCGPLPHCGDDDGCGGKCDGYCAAFAPICDPETYTCVECISNSDCGEPDCDWYVDPMNGATCTDYCVDYLCENKECNTKPRFLEEYPVCIT